MALACKLLPLAMLASELNVGSLQLLLVEESKKLAGNCQKAAENFFRCDQNFLPSPMIKPTTIVKNK